MRGWWKRGTAMREIIPPAALFVALWLWWGVPQPQQEIPTEQPTAQVVVLASSSFLPIDNGPCGHNAMVALGARNGALQRVEIAPGIEWSFNETVGDPEVLDYVTCSGVPGGYWCDLAARYLQVGRALGLAPTFQHHGIQLAGVEWENSIAIWSNGSRGGQDLLLKNDTGRTVYIWVEAADGGVIVRGR